MRVVWTSQAEAMLEQALDIIAAERPAAALRVAPELQRQEIREVLVDSYRVPYRRDEQQVTILAVLHDRRLFDLRREDE